MKRSTLRRSAGFTLIEMVLSITALAVVIGTAALGAKQAGDQFRTTRTRSAVEKTTATTARRVVEELRAAGLATLVPDPTPWSSDVAFQSLAGLQVVPVAGGGLDWAAVPLSELRFEYEAGELDDGLDNNGNGLVDEGVLVFRRSIGTADEQRVVLCHGVSEFAEGELPNGVDDNGNGIVDEGGFSLERDGSVLHVRLTLEGVDAAGRAFQRSITSGVRLRN